MRVGVAPWHELWRRALVKCAASLEVSRLICAPPSDRPSVAAATRLARRCALSSTRNSPIAAGFSEKSLTRMPFTFAIRFCSWQRALPATVSSVELHLDLVEANCRQLEDAGLRAAHIAIIDGCTACDTTRFFSHRAEFGKTGRMMAAIGIRPQ